MGLTVPTTIPVAIARFSSSIRNPFAAEAFPPCPGSIRSDPWPAHPAGGSTRLALQASLTTSAGNCARFGRRRPLKLPIMFFGKHFWRGESGRRYLFKCALTKNGIPDDSGGIYVFVKRSFAFFLQPLYVGKAANLRGRLVGHEKWGKAWWILGATERHVMRVARRTSAARSRKT